MDIVTTGWLSSLPYVFAIIGMFTASYYSDKTLNRKIFVWPLFMENYRGGYYAGTAGIVEIKIWPFMAVVVIGSVTTAVQFVIEAWRLARSAAVDQPAQP